MNQEDKDILLRLLQQHKKLGISEQRVYQKFYLDSVISNSVALSNLEPEPIAPEMVDKWSIKPTLAEKLVDILEFVADKDEFTTEQIVSHFGFNTTTAKRYLRQLTVYRYKIFRKMEMMPVLIRSANMAPMMGTIRKGLTV